MERLIFIKPREKNKEDRKESTRIIFHESGENSQYMMVENDFFPIYKDKHGDTASEFFEATLDGGFRKIYP